jgi:hypothetical protein
MLIWFHGLFKVYAVLELILKFIECYSVGWCGVNGASLSLKTEIALTFSSPEKKM